MATHNWCPRKAVGLHADRAHGHGRDHRDRWRALAYPQYSAYLQRGRIIDATTKLSDFRIKMEQYFQDNRTYQNAGATACGIVEPALDVHGQL